MSDLNAILNIQGMCNQKNLNIYEGGQSYVL